MLSSHRQLDQYLQKNKARAIVEIDGLLTAILSGPKLIPPSKWLQLIGVGQIQFNSMEQIQQVMGSLIKLSNDIVTTLQTKTYFPLSLLRADEANNWEQKLLEAQLWSRGYVKGIETWDIDLSLAADKKDADEHIMDIIFPIISLTISDKELEKNYNDQELNLLEFRQKTVSSLPFMAMLAHDFWLPYRQLGSQLLINNTKYNKVGRNDYCLCGSGKKFKKCCLN